MKSVPTICLLLVAFSLSSTDAEAWAAAPGFVLRWGGGSQAGVFALPAGATCDAQGNVLIVDASANRLQSFSSTGVLLNRWGSGGTGAGSFASPRDVAVGSDGDIYVVEFGNNRVSKFSASGSFIKSWGASGTEPGHFLVPSSIALDANDDVYVADTGNCRIQKFSKEGEFLLSWGMCGNDNGQFGSVSGVGVDRSTDDVYTVDASDSRIQVFGLSGTYKRSWGSVGSGEGQLDTPRGIAIDANHVVYVADSDNNRIVAFTANGNFLTQWGQFGNGYGYFNKPFDVAVSANGLIYVVDSLNGDIQEFDYNVVPGPPRPDYPAKLALHVSVADGQGRCSEGAVSHCGEVRTAAGLSGQNGPFFNVYLLAVRGNISSIAGLQCGVEYDGGVPGSEHSGVDIFSWTRCADVEASDSNWPALGSGNALTWYHETNCRFGDVSVVGYFYLGAYSADVLKVIPRPVDAKAKVADCLAQEFVLSRQDLGFVRFSDGAQDAGCNPCFQDCESPSVTKNLTWSGIKLLFR